MTPTRWQGVGWGKARALWPGPRRTMIARVAAHRAGLVGVITVSILGFAAVFAHHIAPHHPLEIHAASSYLPPSWVTSGPTGRAGSPSFVLGTDGIGRDLLSRLLYGARVSLFAGLAPVACIALLGTVVGMISGYVGGLTDRLIMRVADFFQSLPDILLYIVLTASFRDRGLGRPLGGMLLMVLALVLVSWVGVARLVRALVLQARQREYVLGARAIGAPPARILTRHLLPNCAGPVIVTVTYLVPRMIAAEAVLGYLGLGLRPTTDPSATFITSWGTLLVEGQSALAAQPWLLLMPGMCVGVTALAFTFVGDAIRDVLDPRTAR